MKSVKREKSNTKEKLCPVFGHFVPLFICKSCVHVDEGKCGGKDPGRLCPVLGWVDRKLCELCEDYDNGICTYKKEDQELTE